MCGRTAVNQREGIVVAVRNLRCGAWPDEVAAKLKNPKAWPAQIKDFDQARSLSSALSVYRATVNRRNERR